VVYSISIYYLFYLILLLRRHFLILAAMHTLHDAANALWCALSLLLH